MFIRARTTRQLCGGLTDLRNATVRGMPDPTLTQLDVELPEGVAHQNVCGCVAENDESCGSCAPPLDEISMADTSAQLESRGVFEGIGSLLTNVKLYEFTASAEKAYAAIGNHPHQLKATKSAEVPEADTKEAAAAFYEIMEQFLEDNKITVDQIPEAFNLDTLSELEEQLINVVTEDTEERTLASLRENEQVIQRIFDRTDFMGQYLEILRDITQYPIGIMWCDDAAIKKSRSVKNGKMVVDYHVQSSAERVDPRYFWATEDWTLTQEGTMCFRLKLMTRGDLARVAKSLDADSLPATNIEKFLEANPNGSKMYGTSLFRDDILTDTGHYDVLVARGLFSAAALEKAGVKVDASMDNYLRAEVWYAGGEILYVNMIDEVFDDFGVYTTVFRRRGDHLWGIALHDFVYPFAKMYEGAIKAVDDSVGKSVGSMIMLDKGVIEDPGKYMVRNDESGHYEIDFSGDTIFEFDSTNAAMSPNFKGVPIHIEQMPSDVTKLLPVLGMIFQQLEIISGIPAMVSSGAPSSSALRTESLYNQAYEAAAKPIQTILRQSEKRVLEKAVQFFFTSKAASGELSNDLIEVEPQILLSDELTREFNDDQRLFKTLGALQPYIGIIPQERIAGMLNEIGRELGFSEPLVPDVSPLAAAPAAEPAQAV